MQDTRFPALKSVSTVCLFAVGLLLAGCPQAAPKTGGQSASKQPAGAAEQRFNLFTGTPLAEYPPDALDINRDGTRLFAKQYVPGGAATMVTSLPLSEEGLGEPEIVMKSEETIRSFVRAHPTGDSCLLITNVQQPDGPVVDVIWQYRNQQRVAVPYDQAEGFPSDLPPQARYALEPVYSWDGGQIVVPLHARGLCVMDAATGKGRFVAYPDLPGEPTGQALGALPSRDERSLMYVSQWHKIKSAEEWCHITLLDLDSGEWLLPVDLDWLVYQVASDDPLNQPWLLRGSRQPDKATEHHYVPRLALLDPRSGVIDLQMFYGTPYWPVELDPRGRYVAYLDQQLNAIARLEQATARLDLDPRYYDGEAQLFVAPGGEPVIVWHKDTLVRARFTEHQEFGE